MDQSTSADIGTTGLGEPCVSSLTRHVSDSSVRVETQTQQAPHNAVKAEALSVFVGAKRLLVDTELTLAEQTRTTHVPTPHGGSKSGKSGMCYGLVGPNGCGKSTLLRLMAKGLLPVPSTWDVFLVGQHLPMPASPSITPTDEVLSSHAGRTSLLQQQAALEARLQELAGESATAAFEEVSAKFAEVQQELSKWDGVEKDVVEILTALGFQRTSSEVHGSAPTIATPMEHLSGGWRMKVELAKALLLRPKLLLLDEPTNHLDFYALNWLQSKLEEYPHTTVVISHDVNFLHGVCSEILWLKDQKIETMPRDMVSQEDLLRMQRRRALKFQFSVPGEDVAANHGLSLHGVEFSYPSQTSQSSSYPSETRTFKVQGNIRLSGTSRTVLLGKNGSGKSTFLDLCVGNLKPTKGSVDRTPELKIGHYTQLTDELEEHKEDTAAEYLVRHCRDALAKHVGSTRASRLRASKERQVVDKEHEHAADEKRLEVASRRNAQEKRLLEVARGHLSHFGFENDVAVAVPVENLSGGQKACLKFAKLSLNPVHILLLDEPTNHLDAEACEALAQGLSEFQGGVVAVTHDELLIYRLIHCNWSTSELVTCQNGCLRKEKSFGTQCLNALKDQVRRAEEEEAEGCRQEKPKKKLTNQLKVAQEPADTKKTMSPGVAALPPWLKASAKARVRKEKVTFKDVAVTETKRVAVKINASKATTCIDAFQKAIEEAEPKSQLMANAWCKPAVKPAAAPLPPHEDVGDVDAPDSWEDLEEEQTQATAVLEQHAATVPIEGTPAAASESLEASGSGRHSQFRKDLINLNKGVARWMKKGELNRAEIAETIRNSLAAKHLRALHGAAFDENRFIEGVLHRSNGTGKGMVRRW